MADGKQSANAARSPVSSPFVMPPGVAAAESPTSPVARDLNDSRESLEKKSILKQKRPSVNVVSIKGVENKDKEGGQKVTDTVSDPAQEQPKEHV